MSITRPLLSTDDMVPLLDEEPEQKPLVEIEAPKPIFSEDDEDTVIVPINASLVLPRLDIQNVQLLETTSNQLNRFHCHETLKKRLPMILPVILVGSIVGAVYTAIKYGHLPNARDQFYLDLLTPDFEATYGSTPINGSIPGATCGSILPSSVILNNDDVAYNLCGQWAEMLTKDVREYRALCPAYPTTNYCSAAVTIGGYIALCYNYAKYVLTTDNFFSSNCEKDDNLATYSRQSVSALEGSALLPPTHATCGEVAPFVEGLCTKMAEQYEKMPDQICSSAASSICGNDEFIFFYNTSRPTLNGATCADIYKSPEALGTCRTAAQNMLDAKNAWERAHEFTGNDNDWTTQQVFMFSLVIFSSICLLASLVAVFNLRINPIKIAKRVDDLPDELKTPVTTIFSVYNPEFKVTELSVGHAAKLAEDNVRRLTQDKALLSKIRFAFYKGRESEESPATRLPKEIVAKVLHGAGLFAQPPFKEFNEADKKNDTATLGKK
jgi:hypothetical protein